MAFKRPSNGRSPLVNPQRQITSFFSKSPSPNPNPKSTPSPSPSPSTLQPKITKKIPLQSPKHGIEVVNRRIKVYWPLDKNWYQGYIKSFDKASGKHLIQYDDSEEEVLDLSTEKFELIEEEKAKKFRRLRRFSIEEDEDEEKVEEGLESGNDDDSEDEDWEMKAEKEAVVEDEMELEDLGLVNEDEEEEQVVEEVVTPVVKKRKSSSGVKVDSVKKIKTESPISQPASVKPPTFVNNDVVGDRADRFTAREEEKFKFLGKDRKDANKRSPGDENYDPRTLYLPPTFLKSLTGGQRQWWEFKSKHMDKMGKFYELFEMDAHVGAKELDLQYMKGDQPHCGFPEKNFESNVEKLACK
ncbi:DNA mismatch repair protein MSH6, partial [Tanacetum coccineum]